MNGDTPPKPDANQPASSWQYKPSTDSSQTPKTPAPQTVPATPAGVPATGVPTTVTWTASEFIHHSKSVLWYAGLAAIAAVVNVGIFLWTRDIISVIALTTMAILIGIVAGRKPRVLEYELSSAGLTMGQTFHPYADFKSFAVMDDEAFSSIMFLPLKRFMPPVSVYYEPKDEDRILAVLSQYLPVEMKGHDLVDRFSRRIRF